MGQNCTIPDRDAKQERMVLMQLNDSCDAVVNIRPEQMRDCKNTMIGQRHFLAVLLSVAVVTLGDLGTTAAPSYSHRHTFSFVILCVPSSMLSRVSSVIQSMVHQEPPMPINEYEIIIAGLHHDDFANVTSGFADVQFKFVNATGMAMTTKITIGTTVQITSTSVLWVVLLGSGLARALKRIIT